MRSTKLNTLGMSTPPCDDTLMESNITTIKPAPTAWANSIVIEENDPEEEAQIRIIRDNLIGAGLKTEDSRHQGSVDELDMHAGQESPNYGLAKMINIDLMKVRKANPFRRNEDSGSGKRPMTIGNSQNRLFQTISSPMTSPRSGYN